MAVTVFSESLNIEKVQDSFSTIVNSAKNKNNKNVIVYSTVVHYHRISNKKMHVQKMIFLVCRLMA